MTFIVASLYVAQLAVIVYLFIVSFEVMRKFTFSKNLAWVQENSNFAQRYARSSWWPVIGWGGIMCALFIFFGFNGSYSMLFWTRIIGICGVSVLGYLTYWLIERNIRNKIPLSKERFASLLPKKIESYITKNLARTSYAAIAILALAYIISFFAGKISVATFAGDIVFQILVDGICLATIWYVIKSKVPHKKALSPAINEDIGKLSKVINIKLCSLFIVFYSLLALAELVMQWHGYEIPSPLASGWYGLFNETRPPLPIITQSTWDIIVSALSIPLFVYMANNKFMRAIGAENLLVVKKDESESI